MGMGSGRGLAPAQMIVIKLGIKEIHFKTFTLLTDCTSLLQLSYWCNDTSCCIRFFF